MTVLTALEAQTIIAALKGIPPSEIKEYLKTKDQINYFQTVREHYQTIGDYLESYFSGKEKPAFGKLQELYDSCFEYYLKLYDLIFHCWDRLKRLAEKENLSIPETPGNLLILILESDAEKMMAVCFSSHRSISVKKARSLLKAGTPIDLDSPMSSLSSQGKAKRKHYQQNAIVSDSDRWITLLKEVGNQSKKTRCYVKNFDRAFGDQQATLSKYLHPSMGVRGGVWRNGEWSQNA